MRHHSESRNYLPADPWPLMLELLGFARALDPDATLAMMPSVGRGLLLLSTAIGSVLLAIGIASRRISSTPAIPQVENGVELGAGRSGWALPIAALFVTALLLVGGDLWHGGRDRLRAIGLVLPWMVAAATFAAVRAWPRWAMWRGRASRLLASLRLDRLVSDLIVVQAILPVLALLLLSMARPTLVARARLVFAPFYLLLIARGLGALRLTAIRANAITATATIVLLGCWSTYQYATIANSPRDYQSLAMAIRPLLQPNDLVVIENGWWAQPLHYYLPPDLVRTFGSVAAAERVDKTSGARLWVVAFGDDQTAVANNLTRKRSGLNGYAAVEPVIVTGAAAELFIRR